MTSSETQALTDGFTSLLMRLNSMISTQFTVCRAFRSPILAGLPKLRACGLFPSVMNSMLATQHRLPVI